MVAAVLCGQGVQPADGVTLQDYDCSKTFVCTGAAIYGMCKPQGFACRKQTCGDTTQFPNDGCDCELLSYNQCACSCADAGPGTVEAGSYRQCL